MFFLSKNTILRPRVQYGQYFTHFDRSDCRYFLRYDFSRYYVYVTALTLVFYGSYFWRESKTLKLKLTLEVRHFTNTKRCTLFPAPLLLLKPHWFWSNNPRLLDFMFQLFWNFELISVFLALVSLLAFKSPLLCLMLLWKVKVNIFSKLLLPQANCCMVTLAGQPSIWHVASTVNLGAFYFLESSPLMKFLVNFKEQKGLYFLMMSPKKVGVIISECPVYTLMRNNVNCIQMKKFFRDWYFKRSWF